MQGSACTKTLWAPGELRKPAEIRLPTTPIGQLTNASHSALLASGALPVSPPWRLHALGGQVMLGSSLDIFELSFLEGIPPLSYSLQMLSRSTSTIINIHQTTSVLLIFEPIISGPQHQRIDQRMPKFQARTCWMLRLSPWILRMECKYLKESMKRRIEHHIDQQKSKLKRKQRIMRSLYPRRTETQGFKKQSISCIFLHLCKVPHRGPLWECG